MPAITVSAIVLRSVNYRDNDRILTLLTPNKGRVEVMSRGCRRPKSPFMSASEVFCTGEYVLFSQHDKNILTSCTLHDSFYPLRLDYGLLSCGAYLLNLCEAAAQPEEESGPLFWLLLKALNRLAYGQEERRGLVSGFLLHYAVLLGYKPRLNHCVHCGRKLEEDEPVYFDCEAGGLKCTIVRERNSPVGQTLDEPELGESLRHRRGGRRAHTHPLRERRCRDALARGLEDVDRLQVVLDGDREIRALTWHLEDLRLHSDPELDMAKTRLTRGKLLAVARCGPRPLHYALLEGSGQCGVCGIGPQTTESQPLVIAHRRRRAVAVASQLTRAANGWLELPADSLLLVDRDLRVQQKAL
jgi:DNA repair protein RecO (recombination protein O)